MRKYRVLIWEQGGDISNKLIYAEALESVLCDVIKKKLLKRRDATENLKATPKYW